MLRSQMSLAVTALLIQLGMAANYTVGGPNGGWDTSSNLQAWASAQTFIVGDNLIFQFTPNHDVLEVSKADYNTCSTSNPTQTYSSSPAVIPLSSPGKRCFICGMAGHCSQGMKIELDTLASSSPPSASPSSPPTSSPASPVTPPTSSPSSPVTPPTSSPASPVTAPTSPPPLEMTPPPKSTPTISPASLSTTPTSSPAPSSDVPSAEPPTSSPSPSPSSAHKGSFEASLIMGFGLMMTILLAL
ncbi:hypothetical protein PVL29_015548 [Vitis rotundifolia]|uniref:Phytocyanin domain-containing protein n=1 Tax=Vitis rotundifolia TaxID=103349 RepID=A0AA38ZD85_VITRO|nr:hypothetical protein PVL29_015548 [Vitis rotundifolia]